MNQAEDIASLSHRKINDVNQRHAIRSHVMQRVRQEELAQGKKRPTGRDHPKRNSRIPIRSRSSDSDSSGQSDPTTSRSQSVVLNPPSGAFEGGKVSIPPLQRQLSPPKLLVAPAVHEFDPFETLPTRGLSHRTVENLLQYCK